MSGNERRSSSSSSSAPSSSPEGLVHNQDASANNMMAHRNRGDDSTQNSGSSLSNLSGLDSETDELGKRILEHARDQKRLRDATNGTIQAFRHARSRPRVALTLENLERNRGVTDAKKLENVEIRATRSHDSQSGGSEHSESSNVPRQWGRRGRHRNDFLRRIHTYHNAEVPREDDPDAIWPRRTMYTGDSPSRRRSGDWASVAADIPVPSVEPESPLSRPQSSHATLPRQRRNDLLAKIIELEQEEARNGDAKTSLSHKRRSSELTRLRELANVKEMGVTRNRLDELDSGSRTKSQEADQIHEEGGEVGLASSNSSGDGDRKLDFEGTRAAALANDANTYRPGHRRQDSRDLLKRLARAASSTPSPTSRHLTSPPKRRVMSSSASGTDQERSPLDGQQSLPTPEQTPQPPKTAPAQTPRVSGAWIETPAPSKESVTPEKHNNAEPPTTEIQDIITLPKRPSPQHPKSALEMVLAEATSADKASEAMGDETIQSLKGLISEATMDEDLSQLDEDTLQLIRKVSEPVHHAARDKEEENALLEAMARTLKSTRSSLKDAARSMKRVENQVESADAAKKTSIIRHSGHHADCQHCMHGKITLSLLISQAWAHFMLKFYNWPKNGRLTFTTLGLCTVLFLAWSFSEVALCEVYCHKTTAWYMVGNGVDISAPEMPFVTLTILIKRPFRFILEPAGYILAWLIWITGVTLQTIFPDAESPGFTAGRAIKAAGTKTAIAVVRSFNAGYIYWDRSGGADIT